MDPRTLEVGDRDGDGLTDDRELALGTDPETADTDADGFDDGFEDRLTEFGFDPVTVDRDGDADGLTDLYEESTGLDPGSVDTDRDGWGDFDEVLNEPFGYDPRVPTEDADFDGVADSLESELGSRSDRVDSDGDGVSDFEEVQLGSDPAVAEDVPTAELVGTTYSQAMADALEAVRRGERFPTSLTTQLPYDDVTGPPVERGATRPSAALMQRSVYNPAFSPGLYPTHDEAVRQLRDIARRFDGNPGPRIVRLFRWSRRTVDCCTNTGGDKPGRRIYAVKISDSVRANEDEPEILFMGMHHARELLTTSITLGLVDRLTTAYAAGNAAVQALVDASEIWVIPVVNPDGYQHEIVNKVSWRKNRRRVRPPEIAPPAQAIAQIGVDLNRNYGFGHVTSLTPAQRAALANNAKWSNGLTAAGAQDPNDETYGGSAAFSEVEIQAVRGLARDRFRTGSEVDGPDCSLSWHTYGGEVGHPMAHTPFPPNTGLRPLDRVTLGALTGAVATATGYVNLRDQFANLHYPVFGDSDDWLHKADEVLSLLVEAFSNAERGPGDTTFYPTNAGRRDAATKNNVEGGLVLVRACSGADFGDAGLVYPTRLVDRGARHVETGQEWLGRDLAPASESVSEELDAVDPTDADGVPNLRSDLPADDLDRFDDGVVFHPLTYVPGQQGKVEFRVCAAQLGARYDPADPDKTLYVNGWIDWDDDGRWEEANAEHVVDGLRIAPVNASSWTPLGSRNPATTVTQTTTATDGKCASYQALFPVGRIGKGLLWSRFRVDYGEDVGRNDPRPLFRSHPTLRDPTLPAGAAGPGAGRGLVLGRARFGEVEDYLIGSDFGDAPDPFAGVPGRYPSRKQSEGARHLTLYREWLGPPKAPSVTRETDACDASRAEQDGIPNLGPGCTAGNRDVRDDGAVVPAVVKPNQKIVVPVTVSARADAFGFANRGPAGQDSKGTQTLKPNCGLGPIADAADTPAQHRDRGRYAAWDPLRRLYLKAWVDWNADGVWDDPGERVVSGPLDPEDWGGDGSYTLGEPFSDADTNRVRTDGEAFTDLAGARSRTLQCPIQVPANVAIGKTFYWRFRLDYGENLTTNDDVVHHADEDGRTLAGPKGGALWGEVEDYPSRALEVDEEDGSRLVLVVEGPTGTRTLDLRGSSVLEFDIGGIARAGGSEEVRGEVSVARFEGRSRLGSVVVRTVEDAVSTFTIRELADATPGTLDLPPFTETGVARGTVTLHLEVTLGGVAYRTVDPIVLEGELTHKPPKRGELFVAEDLDLRLVDAAGRTSEERIVHAEYAPSGAE